MQNDRILCSWHSNAEHNANGIKSPRHGFVHQQESLFPELGPLED